MDKHMIHHQDIYTKKQALLSADPHGEIELTDADLEAIYGGSEIYAQPLLNSVGLGGSKGSGNGDAGLGSQKNALQQSALQIPVEGFVAGVTSLVGTVL
jgi:hypothetical protein